MKTGAHSQYNNVSRDQDIDWLWEMSGGATVLGKLPVPGSPTIWVIVGQGPIALAVHVGAGGGCLDIFLSTFFSFHFLFFPLSPSLRETARYRLKTCLKGPG